MSRNTGKRVLALNSHTREPVGGEFQIYVGFAQFLTISDSSITKI
jgi:hypothetical protein